MKRIASGRVGCVKWNTQWQMSTLAENQIHSEIPLDGSGWKAVIYNNDSTNVGVVILMLITATGCTQDEAEIEVWEAEHFGKANVHFGSKTECEKVAQLMSTIGVYTEVVEEWSDCPV